MAKASLPIAFDTPMFWCSEDLEQLRGTAVLGRLPSLNRQERGTDAITVDKIGKQQAENDYLDKVVPLLKVRTPVREHLGS